MKCQQCTGHLNPKSNVCPYCGSRVEADLKSANFRDLGPNPDLPCPECREPLDVLEFDTNPRVAIERCKSCLGTFFNPGEIELLLQHYTTEVLWVDHYKLKQLKDELDYRNREIKYFPCPTCGDRMSHLNFGSDSGVILDRCSKHGLWVRNGQIQQLAEWWRAGGRILYEKHQQEPSIQLFLPTDGSTSPTQSNTKKPKSSIPVEEEPSPWSLRGLIADFLCLFDE